MERARIRIRTIEVPVSDLSRSLQWYGSALGFQAEWQDENHALLSLPSDSDAVQLLLVRTDGEARLRFRSSVTGVEHSAFDFEAADLEALHEALSTAGCEVDPLGPPSSDWAPRGFGFSDPDGNRLGAFAAPRGRTVRGERPTFIVSSIDVEEEAGMYPGTTEVLSHGRAIGAAAGLQRLGCHIERLPAGHRTSFPHAHEDEEEFVYVLEGKVDAWIDGALHPMVAGDIAAFPAGTGIAHTILNHGPGEALLLVAGERSMGKSRLWYPLNPERRERLAEGRWWGDVPSRRMGAWPPRPTPPSEAAPILVTDRLLLRWWELGDAEAMFRIFGEPAVHRYTRAEPYADVAAARAWLEREAALAPARGFGHWAVVEKESGEVVGSCGFRAGFLENELELGFTVAHTHWGKGYATEAAAACVRFGIEKLRATNILALTLPENRPARGVLERVGMALRGLESHDGTEWCVYERRPA